MNITSISVQKRDNNRVNISVDGKYRFSLDVYQLADLKIKVGNEYEESEIVSLEQESQFGKLYSRALEYCFIRPHSAKEVRDYLYRKTMSSRTKTGEAKSGIAKDIAERVYDRLLEKGYIDDTKFTQYWVNNRSLTKGVSQRKLKSELYKKGVSPSIIDESFRESVRSDSEEIKKIIVKKRLRYPDNNKFIAYLARLGFSYDDIKQALESDS